MKRCAAIPLCPSARSAALSGNFDPKTAMTLSKRSRLAASLAFACGCFIALLVRPAHAAPVRVVSQSVGGDELLLAVANPSQNTTHSQLADDASYSAVSE